MHAELPGYPRHDRLRRLKFPCSTAGDVNARVWMRIREVEQSLALVEQDTTALPCDGGAITLPRHQLRPTRPCEGLGMAEAFRGDVLVWLRLADEGRVARCHLRDPSWFQWPLLETGVEGNIVADFPLCNKSFNCSYARARPLRDRAKP